MLRCSIAALCIALLPGVASAQPSPAESSRSIRITGRVVDPANMSLRRVTVTLIAVGTGTKKSAQTDDAGVFVFDSLAPATYELRFEAPGFLSHRPPLIKAAAGHDVNTGSIMLQFGEITEGPLTAAKKARREKPITVCESLADPKKFSGKPVAIVGRIECGASLIDHVCFLDEDRCEKPVITDGYTWPNKVLIIDYWEKGMPKPPSRRPAIDQSTLMQKLLLVRNTTSLGLHEEPQFKSNGQTITFSRLADVKDEWGIAYGLFFTAPKLRQDGCGDEIGSGGFDEAPVALITMPDALHPVHAAKR